MAVLRLSTCNLFPENETYWASRQPNEKEKETRVERMVMVGQNGCISATCHLQKMLISYVWLCQPFFMSMLSLQMTIHSHSIKF